MKATGIVRRIDDLGRVVIPKEIRRTMRIREGDPLEIYTDREGEVIFKKYSPMGEMNSFATQYADTMHKTCDLSVAICDRDAIIACAGLPKREYNEKPISSDLERILEGRSVYQYKNGERKVRMVEDASDYYITCAMPILTEGDVTGCVVSATKEDAERSQPDLERKLVQTAAGFLGRQLEN